MSLFALSEVFERTKRDRSNLLMANVALRHRLRRAEHELDELRMTVHQFFGLQNETARHALNGESATYEMTLRMRRFGCHHPSFTDDGVCTLCREHYDPTRDQVVKTVAMLQRQA